MARELEALAAASHVKPAAGFADRVMNAVASEPLPQPARAFGAAVGARRLGAALASIGDAWRVVVSGPTPLAVRAQALALVLVVAHRVTRRGRRRGGRGDRSVRCDADVPSQPDPAAAKPAGGVPEPEPEPVDHPESRDARAVGRARADPRRGRDTRHDRPRRCDTAAGNHESTTDRDRRATATAGAIRPRRRPPAPTTTATVAAVQRPSRRPPAPTTTAAAVTAATADLDTSERRPPTLAAMDTDTNHPVP